MKNNIFKYYNKKTSESGEQETYPDPPQGLQWDDNDYYCAFIGTNGEVTQIDEYDWVCRVGEDTWLINTRYFVNNGEDFRLFCFGYDYSPDDEKVPEPVKQFMESFSKSNK